MSRGRRRSRLRRVSPVVVGAAVLGVLVLALVAFTVKHESPPVAGAGSTPGYTPVTTRPPVVLWVGDSYTAGTGADGIDQSYPYLTAHAFGWAIHDDGEGGSGFVNSGIAALKTNTPMIDRLPADTAYYADVVVIDGGRDDGAQPRDQVQAAIPAYFAAVRKQWPNAKIVDILPKYVAVGGYGDDVAFILTALRAADAQYGAYVVDPVAENWYDSSDVAEMIYKDGIHPNEVGQKYIASKLVDDFKSFGLGALKSVPLASNSNG